MVGPLRPLICGFECWTLTARRFCSTGRKLVASSPEVKFSIQPSYTLVGIRGIYRTEVTLLTSKGTVVFGPWEIPEGRTILSKSKQGWLARQYADGIRVQLTTSPHPYPVFTRNISVGVTITNQLPSSFSKPRVFRVYLNESTKPIDVTLARGQVWKHRFVMPISKFAPSRFPVSVSLFDKEGIGLVRPDWNLHLREAWPYAGGSRKILQLREPRLALLMTADAPFHEPGATASIKLEMHNSRQIAFAGRVDMTLRSAASGSKLSWSKQFLHRFSGKTIETLTAKIPLPKDVRGFTFP